ncbi:hypothetical protein [Lacipirellula parvula]|uniref:Uncharacterized protein n=1 Tax=Lacipirellula parvula TaxID=2650471 RepID=A0A5K7XGK9_9BACT|nr:hypothetical protein [Lacipirellula parvula]BBO35535.1 hypothetical protein PLANPX_5147 [Lacipirellula parvula]
MNKYKPLTDEQHVAFATMLRKAWQTLAGSHLPLAPLTDAKLRLQDKLVLLAGKLANESGHHVLYDISFPVPSRPVLTIEDHRQLGESLYFARNSLFRLLNCYPKQNTITRRLSSLIDGFDRLRCKLDSYVAGKWPGEFDPSIYYPAARLAA